MNIELRQLIDHSQYHQGALREVMALLPGDDAELDRLIGEAVKAGRQKDFLFLVMPALEAGRKVDARHLGHGAIMLLDWATLGCVAWHMDGNVPEYLLEAFQHSIMPYDTQATLVFVVAAWCREHRAGVLPPGLVTIARQVARAKPNKPENPAQAKTQIHLAATVMAFPTVIEDAGLTALIHDRYGPTKPSDKQHGEEILQFCRARIFDRVLAAPARQLAHGATMRRAVAKVGRNEPCPCGSGKKYKQCCIEKDEERLHHSSEVAGRTREEVDAEPEAHLTAARLEKLMPYDLGRLDPVKIPAELVELYFAQLAGMGLHDRIAEAFEQLGFSEKLENIWKFVLFFVTRAGRKDVAERMLRVRPDAARLEKDLDPAARLLLAQDDPARILALLEELSLRSLQTENSEALEKFAYGLVENSRLKALGIFVARSMVPLIEKKDASFLFDRILEARDKLDLPPEDPFGDIMDRRFADHEDDHKKESEEIRKAQQKLNAKVEEVRQLKESLAGMQKEITRQEQKRAVPMETIHAAAPVPTDEPALKELRQKVDSLKSALKERHHERNDLRRELQQAHTDLEQLRQSPASVPPDDAELEREDELLLPQDAPEVHPVRLIEFPKGFQHVLAGFPRHVARAAVIMIGRLAAGEPAAFVGALRLKAVSNVMRQRIGSDFRLLFRLHPDHLQVIDLINRKDLDRRIKTLT
jgi:SEC-C motif